MTEEIYVNKKFSRDDASILRSTWGQEESYVRDASESNRRRRLNSHLHHRYLDLLGPNSTVSQLYDG